MNMRISIANIFTHLFLLLALLATASCSDWTDQKTVDIDPQHAKEQNPELWARYMEPLRTYRQSKHFVTYGSFDNSAEKSKNEGDYLRSLPDSLDIVTPTHPESLTSYDCEDILLLQEKMCLTACFNRFCYLFTRRVHHPGKPDKCTILFKCLLSQCMGRLHR